MALGIKKKQKKEEMNWIKVCLLLPFAIWELFLTITFDEFKKLFK